MNAYLEEAWPLTKLNIWIVISNKPVNEESVGINTAEPLSGPPSCWVINPVEPLVKFKLLAYHLGLLLTEDGAVVFHE